MQKYLFKDIQVVNEGKIAVQDVLTANGKIEQIGQGLQASGGVIEMDGTGKYLLPGVIDDQVHFREPGLTHKGCIYTESKAAVAGGTTSFMEMPNTIPNALSMALLEDKYNIAARTSLANYSFFMGVSNHNAEEALKVNALANDICGIKIFLGASTGNMLVDNYVTLEKIFSESQVLIATHCESEPIIKANYERLLAEKGELSPSDHPLVRDEIACYESSLATIQIAQKFNTRLHILHISTEKELQLFTNWIPLEEKRITSEVCVHHLHFTADDYARLGYRIKCNPAIKAPHNKSALWEALLDDRLDIIATDHAPHLLTEKEGPYQHAHAGLPLVQHALPLMLHYQALGKISLEKIVEKMCHAPARCFQLADRGYIREGYAADLVVVDPKQPFTVEKANLWYRCGWSPLEGTTFPASITHTFVNGHLVYGNGVWDESQQGQRLQFKRND